MFLQGQGKESIMRHKRILLITMSIMICLLSAINVEARGHGDVQTTTTSKLYATQSTTSRVVGTVPKGDVVTIGGYGYGTNWYYVFYLGKKGYIQRANTKQFPASYTRYAKSALTLRQTASDTASSVTQIKKGDKVVVQTTNGAWSFLEYKGMYYGWVRTSNLTTAQPAAPKKVATTVNLTAQASVPSYMKYLKYNDTVFSGLNSKQKKFVKMLFETLKTSGNKDYIDMGNSWGLTSKEEQQIDKIINSIYFPFGGEINYMKQSTPSGTQWRLYAGHSRGFAKRNDKYIQRVKKIVSPYVKSGMTVRQKVIAIDKGICKHMKYAYNYDEIKAISTGKGVCQCYARLFQAACLAYDIPCKYVTGKAYNGSWGAHAWNRVLIGKTWYYTDPTWNDTTGTKDYLLSKKLWKDHK